MSFAGFPINFPSSPAIGFFGSGLSSIGEGFGSGGLIQAQRSIQDLTPDVVVEELHTDRLVITQHPVEKTASITDHAFKEPPTVMIRCGWSASSEAANGDPNYVQGIYDQLRQYQDDCELLNVYTGKRKYDDMLLAEIQIVTDQSSEFALMAELHFQFVILVETSTVSMPANSAQSQPKSTGTEVNRGPQNAKQIDADTAAYNNAIAAEQKSNADALRRSGF